MNLKSNNWKGVTGGGNFGQKSLIFLFKYCDVRIGYFFMYLVIPFYLLFGFKTRKASVNYFKLVYGYSAFKSFFCAWKNYNNFGKVLLDRFAIFAGKKTKFKIESDGLQLFDNLLSKKEGFMMIGSHTGNFEICGYLLNQHVKKIYALVFGGESKFFTEQRLAQLNKNNVEMLPVEDDMSHLFAINQAIENGDIVTMPGDRLFGSSKSVLCKFGNAKAEFPIGPFAIASIRNVNILAVFVYRLETYKYKIVVRNVDCNQDLPKRKKAVYLTESFVSLLEQQVLSNKYQWFNFYDFFKADDQNCIR